MAYEPCDCPDENTCGLRMAMLEVRNEMSNILDKTSLADMQQRIVLATPA
jgi:DNA-binding IscR family transcriptional regulator